MYYLLTTELELHTYIRMYVYLLPLHTDSPTPQAMQYPVRTKQTITDKYKKIDKNVKTCRGHLL